jgi:predicted nucleic acid-binding protein
VETLWIDKVLHNLAVEIWFSLGRRKLSLVDCTSFIIMRHDKIEKVFGFDKHFTEHGFEVLNDDSWVNIQKDLNKPFKET